MHWGFYLAILDTGTLIFIFARYSLSPDTAISLKSIINAAKENNRKVSIAGRSIDRTIEAARQSGYFDEIESIIHDDKLKYVSK